MRFAQVLLRAALAAYFVLTSLYALLAYVPFTFQQVHKGGLVPALNSFGWINHYFYWGALALAAVLFCLEPLPEGPPARLAMRLRAAFWFVHIPVGICISVFPPFGAMENSMTSYAWSIAMLEPILYLAAIVWIECWPDIRWAKRAGSDDTRIFFAAWCSAVFLSYVYSAIGAFRGSASLSAAQCVFALMASLATHLLIFLGLFAALNLMTVVANWFERPPMVQFFLCYLFGTGVMILLLRGLVFPAISFGGNWAATYAASLGIALAALLSSISVRLRTPLAEIENGIALALWIPPPARSFVRSWWRLAAIGAVFAAIAASLAIGSAKNDWNHLFQKLTALLVWVAVFRLFYLVANWKIQPVSPRPGRMLVLTLALLPAYRIMDAAERSIWTKTGSNVTFYRFLDSYAGFDASFKLMHDVLATAANDGGFYGFLSKNTNLPRSTRIEPADVNLADLQPVAADPVPHIFVFVVDSLRRDYVSAYNSQVDFTPNLGKFAEESVVMRNSFSHYGGTGLSEPSIWVGGLMIHKQYVTPFAPMNSLQKLLNAHHYQQFISRDSILETVVTESPNLRPLDQNVVTMNLDLCKTVSELEGKLDAAAKGPIFSYTQPQNIHISTINREGGKAIDNSDYRGFYAPYASRLKRIDGCFGGFVKALKDRGLYDNSVIVFTADHGDSLGEEGRWGHAYTIYPEVLRVPLIVHLPSAYRERFHANTTMLAFNNDVTPSLYYLLGHRPIVKSELFGRPLFTERPEELNAYKRDSYLISSSYAAVYGILSGDGKFLFTADAVNYKDSWFDLTETMPAARAVNSSMKSDYQKLIRERIAAISGFYRFTPLQAEK